MLGDHELAGCLLLLLGLFVGGNVAGKTGPAQARSGPVPIHSEGTTFYNVASGQVIGEKGLLVPFTGYKASDGTGLNAIDPEFKSPAKAKEYFALRIAKAQKVIRRGKKEDSGGKVIGERAEAIYTSPDGSTFPAILWTDGRVFREIDSRSLALSLKLEKAFTP
jgi:hypothetical protein